MVEMKAKQNGETYYQHIFTTWDEDDEINIRLAMDLYNQVHNSKGDCGIGFHVETFSINKKEYKHWTLKVKHEYHLYIINKYLGAVQAKRGRFNWFFDDKLIK